MPSMEVSDLHQYAVLWADSDTFGNFGRRELSAGVEIKIRWQQKQGEVFDSKGNIVAYDSLAVVDRNIPVGSILWLGKLADIPNPVTNLRKVIAYSETPDVKNRIARRTIKMSRSSDELPDLA